MHKTPTHGNQLAEINIVPLVDVVLVLLIIFMITAPLLDQGLTVDLPEATAPAVDRSEDDIYLTVDRQGRLYLQNERTAYTPEQIEPKLQSIYARRDRKVIFIKADAGLTYGTVVKVMGLLHRAGIDRIGMITEEEPPTEEPGS